jgi:hypothetical protein
MQKQFHDLHLVYSETRILDLLTNHKIDRSSIEILVELYGLVKVFQIYLKTKKASSRAGLAIFDTILKLNKSLSRRNISVALH